MISSLGRESVSQRAAVVAVVRVIGAMKVNCASILRVALLSILAASGARYSAA